MYRLCEDTSTDEVDDKNSPELVCEHFTRWFKWGMATHEFWEIFFTDRRVIFAFVGETYTTFLLRGDMSDPKRQALRESPVEAILKADKQNTAVPYAQVSQVTLKRGNLFTMPRLTIEIGTGTRREFFINDRRYDLRKHLPELERLLPGKVRLV